MAKIGCPPAPFWKQVEREGISRLDKTCTLRAEFPSVPASRSQED
jgi:hypothetical protein